MVRIAPSILAADFANLERDCRRVISPGNNLLHFDVMDGSFVPNISIGLPVLESMVRAVPEACYDVHLMIQRPDRFVEQFAKAGAESITIHYEAEGPIRSTLKTIRKLGRTVGISLRPGTRIEEIFPFLEDVDQVLVMSVEPGFGGQSFMPETPQRIAALRAEAKRQGKALLIEVDGGINTQTAPLCVEAGADILVAGSAVFKADDPAAMIEALKKESAKALVNTD